MRENVEGVKPSSGFRHFLNACGYSYAGFREGLANETAIRQICGAFLILFPISLLLPLSTVEHLILVVSMMQVVLVEFLNSAIERVVDRISLERHPLSKHAKDFGSVATGIALLISVLCWVAISGPVIVRWISK
jgi:diacylglycerol kinase (ATP)